MRKIILVLLICLVCFECGYRLRGTGTFLPDHIKKINIPMFKNRTTRFQLDLMLTQSVIDEVVARGKVEITGDSATADAILVGEILSFDAVPIAFGAQATADRYNIIVATKIVLRDLVNNKVIYSNPSLSYQYEYQVPEGADFESVETEALDKLAERFARSLVITMLEGF
ncbi:MAG: LPS assembly lipoprotein LptE [Candidatus Aminicenantes bacterium]|jgi:hypothetical protein